MYLIEESGMMKYIEGLIITNPWNIIVMLDVTYEISELCHADPWERFSLFLTDGNLLGR